MAKCQRASVIRLAFVRFILTLFSLTIASSLAWSDIQDLGVMSWDELNPGAVNGFTIANLTSYFSLPPDFPVVDQVVLGNAEVLLTDDSGTTLAPILLGDLGPGYAQPVSLQFLSTKLFKSAEFKATLNRTTFGISGGSTFVADTTAIDLLLLPGAGSTLLPGVDLVPITVAGTITTVPVPEPSAWFLLLTFVIALSVLRKSEA